MSKKKIQRTPVPEDVVRQFALTVQMLASQLGLDKVPEVYHYVELLDDACARHSFDQTHAVSPQRKSEKKKRQFIMNFKNRHLQLTDFEYTRPITGVDGKLIKQVCAALTEKSFEVDEFLQWVFDSFLADNPKFCPPSIKWTCSNFVVEKFFYEHRSKMKERHKQELHRKEGLDLINRARALMRLAGEAGDTGQKEKIKQIMLDYRDKRIMLGEFRNRIEALERQNRGQNNSGQQEA